MAIPTNLIINGAYLRDIVNGSVTPTWLEGVGVTSRLMGQGNKLLDLTSGLKNLSSFLFRTPKWAIDGVYFDGIMHTNHDSSVRLTDFPVQDGSTGTDHAVIEPAHLSIEIMMTDTNPQKNKSAIGSLKAVYQLMKNMVWQSNYLELDSDFNQRHRSVAAYTVLRCMQLARKPLTVETRLRTYRNMMIVDLSVPDDVSTLHALKCSVRLREIITVGVSSFVVSKRPDVIAPVTEQGQKVPVEVTSSNKTGLRIIQEDAGNRFNKLTD